MPPHACQSRNSYSPCIHSKNQMKLFYSHRYWAQISCISRLETLAESRQVRFKSALGGGVFFFKIPTVFFSLFKGKEAFGHIYLVWPPPCNSDRQDYYMFRIEDSELNLHFPLLQGGGHIQHANLFQTWEIKKNTSTFRLQGAVQKQLYQDQLHLEEAILFLRSV